MPGLFVFAIVIFIIAVILFLIGKGLRKRGSSDDTKDAAPMLYIVGAAVLAFGLLLTFFSSYTTVSTKNVGITTAFGRTVGHLSNGLHFIAPWEQVTEMDAAIQADSYTGDNCLNVRIANQQNACVNVSIRWRIKFAQADDLFQNYRTFENVRDSLVTRELTAAVNNQLSNYNPLNSILIQVPTGNNYPTNPSLTKVAHAVTRQMRSEIGSDIDVINTIIPIMTFDPATQARLNQLQQQEALTRVAIASDQTNEAQAAANQALAQSVNDSPNVLVAQCMSILSEMVKNGQSVPAGFSCWPGGGVTGVIANATTK